MFDTESFIHEIEQRPAIWRQYAGDNRDAKTGEWQQVARAMYQEWDDWTPLKKNEAGRELQKKWKNIKDNFTKALKDQKAQRDNGFGAKRRRKYIYFDQLAFLLTTDVKKENTEEMEDTDEMMNCDALLEIPVETQLDENVQFLEPPPLIHQTAMLHAGDARQYTRKRKRKVPYRPLEERLLTLLDKRQQQQQNFAGEEQEMDEDRAFFLSLLPPVRRLNDEQKIDFRLEVLNCLRRLLYAPPVQETRTRPQRGSNRIANRSSSNCQRNQEPSSSFSGKAEDPSEDS